MVNKKRQRSERRFGKGDLVRQAILSAETSLQLARRLLMELEAPSAPGTRELEGVIGTFEGKFLVTKDGKKYQVPENYASKTMLVYGDTLKMLEGEGGTRFKQIGKVRRKLLEGVLAKKEGKPFVVTVEGSYELAPSAVKHYQAIEGDQLEVLIPEENVHAPYAAIKSNKSHQLRKEMAGEDKTMEKEEKVKKESEKEVKTVVDKKEAPPVKKSTTLKKKAPPKRKRPIIDLKKELPVEEEKKPIDVLEEEDLR